MSNYKKRWEKLKDDAVNARATHVRFDAVKNLKDQAVLAEVAKNDPEWTVRLAAVEKLNDQAALAEVAKKDPERVVRITAIRGLEDCKTLAEIAAAGDDPDVCRRAAYKIDANTWIDLIEREPEKYSGSYILADISVKNKDWLSRLSRESLERVLIHLRDPVNSDGIDTAIVGSIISAYQSGSCADLIRGCGDIVIQKSRHDDDDSCYGIHIDRIMPDEYLRDRL